MFVAKNVVIEEEYLDIQTKSMHFAVEDETILTEMEIVNRLSANYRDPVLWIKTVCRYNEKVEVKLIFWGVAKR